MAASVSSTLVAGTVATISSLTGEMTSCTAYSFQSPLTPPTRFRTPPAPPPSRPERRVQPAPPPSRPERRLCSPAAALSPPRALPLR
ncbi:hypothetical protein GCM10007977_099680 [Dactylosporangium sucinum]|uniref:Uncharacterized protein n=1 Tax=Dactylosporangium sucinum TaxID=1424081 RepID=A0A917X721_9ACTN|nr:hypothetical protein GCM10007977_099680 [Dactylosporangium sucinum]